MRVNVLKSEEAMAGSGPSSRTGLPFISTHCLRWPIGQSVRLTSRPLHRTCLSPDVALEKAGSINLPLARNPGLRHQLPPTAKDARPDPAIAGAIASPRDMPFAFNNHSRSTSGHELRPQKDLAQKGREN